MKRRAVHRRAWRKRGMVAGGARLSKTSRVRGSVCMMGLDENDPEAKEPQSQPHPRLSELGWTDGRNLRMEVRWASRHVEPDADVREGVGRPETRM